MFGMLEGVLADLANLSGKKRKGFTQIGADKGAD
jgi:hypothetical protein